MKTAFQKTLSLGCVLVALLVFGCEDPSASAEQAAATNDPVEQPATQDPVTTPPIVEDVTQPPLETPHDPFVSDPAAEALCPGFWAKRSDIEVTDGKVTKSSPFYLDGIKDPEFEMRATVSINKDGLCCMQMRGALGPIKGGELTLEDEKGLIPLSKADATSSYELFDDGELLVFQFWEDDTLHFELDYTR